MRVWPIVIDSQPAYLSGGGSSAPLLLAPLGTLTVLDRLRSSLAPVTRNALTIVSPAGTGDDRQRRLIAACPTARVITNGEELADRIGSYEPSDVLLIVDPRCLPIAGVEMASLAHQYSVDPRVAHHLVAFEMDRAGTKERVAFDVRGQVRGVLRHYQEATWPFIEGVAATLLPVACGILSDGVLPESLAELRQLVAQRGVPGRDVPIGNGSFDLTGEAGFLAASEHFILSATGAGDRSGLSAAPLYVGVGQSVHPTVRLAGPVIIHSDAHIGEHARVLGPAVIGPGARIASHAVIAQAVVGPDAVVSPGDVIRDRVWCAVAAQNASAQAEYADRPPAAGLSGFVSEPGRNGQERRRGPHRADRFLKRSLDIVVATLGLALLSPVVIAVAAAVWLESKGPIFYGDEREGRDGRAFRCWKFRTMFVGAHAAQSELKALDHTDGPHFKIDRDPRVTRVGRVLRSTNLDEIPQLFNVLMNEMSLVGPRPSPFRENQICVPWRKARLSVRPGITGLWQVCRHDRSAGDFHQWIEYDLLYVQHFSFLLDLKILVATILTLGGKAAHTPARWLVPESSLEARDPAIAKPRDPSGAVASGRREATSERVVPT